MQSIFVFVDITKITAGFQSETSDVSRGCVT